MFGLGYPNEFWLRVTNSVLGTLLLLLVVMVVVGLILDTIRRLRKRLKETAIAPSDRANVGITLPDGGEKPDWEKAHHTGDAEKSKP